jgi:hypothetical protein
MTDINDVVVDGEGVPLQHTWSFWHDKFKGPTQSATEYAQNLMELCSYDTVQGFWQSYGSLPPITQLKPGFSYHMMKKGITPVWEDPTNQRGGIWSIRTPKDKTEFVWRELLLAAVGEQFSDALQTGDDISGVTASIRQNYDIIQIWNTKADGDVDKIRDKVIAILPNVTFLATFYKPCNQHKAFGTAEQAQEAAASQAENK